MVKVALARLKAIADPWARIPWRDADGLCQDDVATAIAKSDFIATPIGTEGTRADHARRIAYLVVHGWSDPISLDFGCPSFPGWRKTWPVTDGNHRLAAALYRDDPEIGLEWGGEVEYARTQIGDVVDLDDTTDEEQDSVAVN